MRALPFLRLGVVGDPVDHSRSPDLHQGFLAEAGIAGSYERIRVAAGAGAQAFAALRAAGYHGLNVTTPLKEEAFAFARGHDRPAAATRAVNTLIFAGGLEGANTDGAGALGLLRDAGLNDAAHARVLVLGAGPTARAAVEALHRAGSRVHVWNRSAARLPPLEALGAHPFRAGDVYDAAFAALAPDATIGDESALAALAATPLVVDANYGPRATLGALLGMRVHDGSRMLEHSARASFELWLAAVRDPSIMAYMEPATSQPYERDGVVVLPLSDEYDVGNVEELRRAIDAANRPGVPLVVDFSRATYMDSSAISAVIRRKAVAARDFRVVVAEDSAVRLIFKIAGLIESLPVHASIGAALFE